MSRLAIKIPGFIKFTTCSMWSILNFRYLINSLSGFRFNIILKPPSFFGTKNTLLSQPCGCGCLTSLICSVVSNSTILLSMKTLASFDMCICLGNLVCFTGPVNSNSTPFIRLRTVLSVQIDFQNGRKCRSLPPRGMQFLSISTSSVWWSQPCEPWSSSPWWSVTRLASCVSTTWDEITVSTKSAAVRSVSVSLSSKLSVREVRLSTSTWRSESCKLSWSQMFGCFWSFKWVRKFSVPNRSRGVHRSWDSYLLSSNEIFCQCIPRERLFYIGVG